MSSTENPTQDNRRVNRTIKKKPKSGFGCGCFLLLILILISLVGSGYYLWKNGQLNSGILSSLKLQNIPVIDSNQSNNDDYYQIDTNSDGLSQTEPFKEIKDNSRNSEGYPQETKAQRRSINSQKKINREENRNVSNEEKKGPFVTYKSNDGKTYIRRARRTSPRRERVTHRSHKINYYKAKTRQTHQKARKKLKQRKNRKVNYNKVFDYKDLVPNKGVIVGSLESLIKRQTSKPATYQKRVKPSQIIVFQSKYYEYEEALNEYAQKLTKLGFNKISIPINKYNQEGNTVFYSFDKRGRKVLISFQASTNRNYTSWRIEAYK
ncbi:MAG: hypothetical protein QNJ31_08960 [Candidatus Caenarcaniphilales bacterium]|nr:hypothetical protein [Candidatus Caenarcaniphilales bacterium]